MKAIKLMKQYIIIKLQLVIYNILSSKIKLALLNIIVSLIIYS